jgi:hypothetical protein
LLDLLEWRIREPVIRRQAHELDPELPGLASFLRVGHNASVDKEQVMANVDLRSGGYTVPANKEQDFTFWWPGATLNEFFDVSISTKAPTVQPSVIPLIEVQRKRTVERDGDLRYVLILTLRNDNGFEVEFSANHVRVH